MRAGGSNARGMNNKFTYYLVRINLNKNLFRIQRHYQIGLQGKRAI